MSDKLTYKITTAIFIVSAYKHNSHHKAYKVYSQFYKRNADCLKVKNTVLAAKKHLAAARYAAMSSTPKASCQCEQHRSAAAGGLVVADTVKLTSRKEKAKREGNTRWKRVIANGDWEYKVRKATVHSTRIRRHL